MIVPSHQCSEVFCRICDVYAQLAAAQKEIEGIRIQYRYTLAALEVSNRKLEHANERIAEFEDIKKAHLKFVAIKDARVNTLGTPEGG